MGYGQSTVAHLLGHKSHASLSLYEHGHTLPTLTIALRLEVILRTPIAFLFPGLYDDLKKEIRAEEERLGGVGQQSLFENYPSGLL